MNWVGVGATLVVCEVTWERVQWVALVQSQGCLLWVHVHTVVVRGGLGMAGSRLVGKKLLVEKCGE